MEPPKADDQKKADELAQTPSQGGSPPLPEDTPKQETTQSTGSAPLEVVSAPEEAAPSHEHAPPESQAASGDGSSPEVPADPIPTVDNSSVEQSPKDIPESNQFNPVFSENSTNPEQPASATPSVGAAVVAAAAQEEKSQQQKHQVEKHTDSHAHAHKGSRKLVVIVAVLVGILLSAAVIYVYLQSDKNAEPITRESTTETTESGGLAGSDVDSAIQEAQTDIDAVTEEELAEGEVSDQTLGL